MHYSLETELIYKTFDWLEIRYSQSNDININLDMTRSLNKNAFDIIIEFVIYSYIKYVHTLACVTSPNDKYSD